MIRQPYPTHLRLTQPGHYFHQIRNPFIRVLKTVKETAARFKQAARNVYVTPCEIVKTAPQTPKEHDRWRDSELRELPDVPRRFEPSVQILVLLEFGLPVKLLL